jgi:hypothetical protein
MNLVAVCAAAATLVGCATPPMMTHITSDPPGARIDVNESFVGQAPVDVTLPQRGPHHRLRMHVTIRAIPTEPDKPEQIKQFYYNQDAPKTVLFDTNRQPPVTK